MNRKYNNYALGFVLLTLSVLYSCKSSEKVTSTDSPAKEKGQTAVRSNTNLSEDDRINLMYNFINANKEKMLGNDAKAAELYAQCLRIDPDNHAAMYEIAQLYTDQKKYNDALGFANSATKLDPSNEWYQLLLGELYQRTGKWNEAIAIYDRLVRDNPRRVDYYFNLANAYLFSGKPNDAIRIYDKVELEIGIDKELIVQKERLYLKLGKTDKAAAELEKLINKFPTDMEAYSLLVDLYQANGMNDKAFETIQRMQKVSGTSPYVYMALAEHYRATGDKEKSFENLKLAFSSRELESDVKIKVLTSYLMIVRDNPDMMKQGLELSRILSDTHPTEANAQAVYGDFLGMDKQYEDSRKQYRAAIVLEKKNVAVWQQLLLVESQLSDFKAMLTESEDAITYFPNEPSLYLFNGIAKIQDNQTEEAIKVLLAGSKLVVDNDAQLNQFYSNLGDCYNKQKQFEESDKYFEKALVLDPKDATVLNNYAYYLSVRGEKLEKAETMSKISNDLSPANSSYEDTYAWIFYKLGRYRDAKEWQEKAMKDGGDKSATVLEHYGDILFKLNETGQALEYWQKAKAAGEGSEFLDKKIAEKKLYE